MIKTDFGQFLPNLDKYNIDILNKAKYTQGWEFAAMYNRFQLGLIFGFADFNNKDHDSLDIELNISQYSLTFGYKIVDNKQLLITPKVALKWNRYQLINNDNIRRISLSQYLIDRDLDVRFNQTMAFLGTSLSYKLYRYNYFSSDYWAIGIYGGYLIKLNENPWIYSKRNRLMSENKIIMSNINLGLTISFIIE